MPLFGNSNGCPAWEVEKMPWTASDADQHKKGLSAKERRQWAAVANSVLSKCMADGGKEPECAAKAIRQANGVAGNEMSVHQLHVDEYTIRSEQHQGHPNIIVPVIMMREGVHSGSHGPLLHPAEELGRFIQTWNGIPVVIQHPEQDGMNVSANSPDIIDRQTVGRIYNAHMDGDKLCAEAWIDLERISEVSPETLAIIQAQHRLDVSVGVFSEDDLTPGNWNGEEYVGVARGHRPDHLALLPGGQGACSWEDGCGVRANAEEGGVKPLDNKVKVVKEDDEEDDDEEVKDEASCAGGDADGKKKKKKKAMQADESTDLVQMLKSVEAKGYTVMQTNADMGYRERLSKVQSVLDTMDNNTRVHFLQEVYDDAVIYEVMNRQGGPPTLYKQAYQVDDKGEVTLTGVATPVVRQVTFVVASSPLTNSDKGGTTMPEDIKKKCCPEKVQALIASEHAPFEEADREWLETLDQPQIDKLVTMERNAAVKPEPEPVKEPEGEPAPITNEQAVQVLREQLKTPEDFIKVLPDEMKDQMTSAISLHRAERTKLISTIKTANAGWIDDELKSKTMAELSKIAGMVPKQNDFTGLAGGTPVQVNVSELLLPSFVEVPKEGGK
jgi:hypothetical protein